MCVLIDCVQQQCQQTCNDSSWTEYRATGCNVASGGQEKQRASVQEWLSE